MNGNYSFFYVEANIVCIILFVTMLARNLRSVDKQTKQRYFNVVLLCHIGYFISDSFWILILNEYLPKNRFTVSLVNLSNAIILLGLACLWNIYVEFDQNYPKVQDKTVRHNIQAPAVVFSFINVIIFLFFNKTVVDESFNVTPFYYVVLAGVPLIYLILSIVRSAIRAFDPLNLAYRSRYLITSLYGVVILIFGILQCLGLQIPLFCFGCAITMFYLYLNALDELISLDPLTGLNNRGQLNRYVLQELQHSSPDKKEHCVVMIDLNDFKSINDVYGHIEGDKALIRAATLIKTTCGNDPLRPFIARYGGDEFILICKTTDENEVITLIRNIMRAFKEDNDNTEKLYLLSASFGFASFKGTYQSFQKALERADKRLYLNKKEYHASH
jgi:diguanylate cyclase (GGDEF)-like protein